MSLLSRYLARLFAREALSLFAVSVFLVWITQTLRLFDLVTAKGQDLLTLAGQATLSTPPLARAILYVCMGIGMVRALKALQASRELHTIHVSRRLGAIPAAMAAFALCGAVAVSLIAHWIEPLSKRAYADWSEEVAADLVGRALNPHRFSEVVPGLILVIGGRQADGTVTDFFADDSRDPRTRRTYTAKSAVIAPDAEGYNISLSDGAIQYVNMEGKFTEVQFSRYDIGLDRLTGSGSTALTLEQTDTLTLLSEHWQEAGAAGIVNERLAEAARVLALCLFVVALAGFPDARRGRTLLPAEMVVLLVGLGERVVSAFATGAGSAGYFAGSLLIGGSALLILGWRLSGGRLPLLRWRAA